MVTIRGRLHMAGSAQKFGVVDGIVSTVATGLPVMKIEVHRGAAALTPCSTFCLHLCLDFAPDLIILGIDTEADRGGRNDGPVGASPSWPGYVGF